MSLNFNHSNASLRVYQHSIIRGKKGQMLVTSIIYTVPCALYMEWDMLSNKGHSIIIF